LATSRVAAKSALLSRTDVACRACQVRKVPIADQRTAQMGGKPFAYHDRKYDECSRMRLDANSLHGTRTETARQAIYNTDRRTRGPPDLLKHAAHIASSGKRRMRSSSESIMESWRSQDRACGSRSAYSRPGGAAPLCYPTDVTPAMIESYRQRQRRDDQAPLCNRWR
jgi:hypothetical protein